MKGFKDFIMRGNLVEFAVAFVMGAAFAALCTAFTKMLMQLIGKVFSIPDFSNWAPYDISVGAFLTALITFLLTALVVYFGIVMPFNKATEIFKKRTEKEAAEKPAEPSEKELLAAILDQLKANTQH